MFYSYNIFNYYPKFFVIPFIRKKVEERKHILKTLIYPTNLQIKIKQPVVKMGYKRGQRKEKYETNKNNMGI